MSNREVNKARTMLANAFATAGAELLEYMGTAAALAAIPNTDPPQYVVAGTLAMIGKVLPKEGAPAAATVLTDERIEAELHRIAAYWENQARRGCVDAFQCALREAWNVASRAHAGVTAELAGWKLVPILPTPEMLDAAHYAENCGHGGKHFGNAYRAMIAAAPTIPAQAPAAEVRADALPGWERGIATVTMNGHQLREALEFINPGGDDEPDERDDELTFGVVQVKDDTGHVSTGLCCWNDDSDGVLPLSGEPSTADSAGTGAMGEGAHHA